MKKYFLYIPALALLAVACNKIDNNEPAPIEEEPAPVVKMITETVSASRGVATKATISDEDASFAWTAGDNVAVHVSNGDSHKYVITSKGADKAASSAKFEVTYEDGYSRDAFALYPSTIVDKDATKYGQSGQPLDLTLPDSYTLAQVRGEVSPCPMISANTAGNGWNFYQLCGLLRLTVDGIPASAKRLEIDFNGKNVAGNFAIPDPVKDDGTSTIALANAGGSNSSVITITKDGANTLGATSLVLNLPIPTGSYEKITVIAYDALTGGSALAGATINFAYSADNRHATKKTATLGVPLQSTLNFTFKSGDTTLENVRFARVFSVKNKLHNTTSYGPYTASAETNLNSHEDPAISVGLYFDKVSDDQLVFQVITSDGKVYSGICDAPADGYDLFKTYDVTADVTAYTFTVASGKKVYFSPGDLGVDSGVYSFTEPFARWGGEGATDAATRVYFEGSEARPKKELYGITWRLQTWTSSTDNEWENLIARTMKSGVNPYYKVQVGSNKYCVLLPPDETAASDIGDDLTTQVTDYVKYIAKGFVILMNTNYKGSDGKWGNTNLRRQGGFYWTNRPVSPADRTLFNWYTSNPTTINASTEYHCLHVRFVRDVE